LYEFPDELFHSIDAERHGAETRVAAWVGKPKEKKPKRPPTERQVTKWKSEGQERFTSGEWAGAKPVHIVAFYCALHEHVYGVEPEEVRGSVYLFAASAAERMLRTDFNLNVEDFIEFIRWVWIREEEREKWRRENGREGGRIGWRLMFSPNFLTDYRISKARRGQEL
jgi:hypothetical protein